MRVMTQARWDLFCRVIDNYGDIGVCWRLARQLRDAGGRVRLWVDDASALSWMAPEQAQGLTPEIEVWPWARTLPAGVLDAHPPADVWIEAFGCELPETFVAHGVATHATPPAWINLEYLSAEDWVAGCHGLPSPQPGGLRKFFFFPGFTEGTGGLLREADVLLRRRAFQADAEARRAFLAGLGIVPWAGARMISLFAYENAALAGWLDALAAAAEPTQLLVPRGRIEADLCRWLGVDTLEDGRHWRSANLQVHLLPFLSQADYDRLLWCCDFNAVRGEDSFVRAQWAGRPLLWHIYQQEEGAHWEKLDAFLDSYCAALTDQAASALRALWSAWNGKGDMAQAWQGLAEHGEQLAAHAEHWCQEQASRPDLAAALVQFHRNWLSCAA